ncbi:cytosine permease [Marinactinospora thermotolerans]|uniref:Cytosine permease n=1 Tax=Marinactinospora thermotolerans DSM 45154 TaxID=1122192 RepID=A0A1T4SB77_9ACTN|nr:cytosine permease [Marinactinospora thermotolerans]SKA25570.1 cytosine permease [Marinactinospora thermotolerans DSM 45154]
MTATAPEETVDPDYPVEPVPVHARKSLLSLSVVLVGFTLFTPTMLAGAQVGAAFRFGPLVGVLLLGSLVLGLYVGVIGWIGARTNLTTVMMSRYSLGTGGAKLASLLLGGTQIGWYGVSIATVGLLTAQAAGWEGDLPGQLVMVAAGAVMGVTAYIGYKGMYWLSVVSVPLLLILAGWVTWRAFAETGGLAGLNAVEPTQGMTLTAAITVIVGTFASGGTQAPNWSRFARTPSAGFWACVVAFFGGQFLMLFCGAIGALAFGEGDFVLVLFQMGLVVWGVVFLVANIWTTNDNAAYAVGVAGAEIFNTRSRKPWVLVCVVLGTLLAVTGIYDHLTAYLTWLGILIPPLGGVIIGDFLLRRRGELPDAATLPVARWDVIAVYAVASLAAWWSNEAGWFVPPVVGILVATGGALALSALSRRRTG